MPVSPFRKIWWRKRTVSEFRKIEFISSWENGGLFEEAAILNGLKKQEIKISSCSMYSSSASTIRNTKLNSKSIKKVNKLCYIYQFPFFAYFLRGVTWYSCPQFASIVSLIQFKSRELLNDKKNLHSQPPSEPFWSWQCPDPPLPLLHLPRSWN